jgi:hypothetical protein
MKKSDSVRHWYAFGVNYKHFTLINKRNATIDGFIEPLIRDNNENILVCVVRGNHHKEIAYNGANTEDCERAMDEAMEWIEDHAGPVMVRIPYILLILKSLMFWKWRAVWQGNKIIALLDKKHKDVPLNK